MLFQPTSAAALALFSLASLGIGFNLGENRVQGDKSLSIGYVIYPGFEPLDIFGPLEILFSLSGTYNMTLSTVSFKSGPVSARLTKNFTIDIGPGSPTYDPKYVLNPTIIATHSFANAPKLDVIVVPGGVGQFLLDNEDNLDMEHFIASRADEAQYVLSVCTGATALARAGLLAGKRATTNKSAWKWATAPRHGANITWVPNARWVTNEKIWTSSGVAAGMDMMYAFLSHYYGPEGSEQVNSTVNGIEFAPHTDPHWDPFAVVHKVPGADTNRSLIDCIGPAGY